MKIMKGFLFFLYGLMFQFSMLGAQGEEGPIRLIIRVDDMGCSHATNLGIVRSVKEGIATSVEIMVPTPWYPEAVAMLAEIPQIDVGIHITLTSEWTNIKWRPVTDVPSLVDERGYFYPMIWTNAALPGKALQEHQYDLAEIEKEVRAQIEIAKNDIPNLTHFSAHMGCSNLSEETKELFERIARDYNLDIFPQEKDVRRFPYQGDNRMAPEIRVQQFIKALRSLASGTYMFVEHPAESGAEQEAIGHPG
ncbi:MAG: ChbG/HpnK family deacetylase, partial [Saprospiraceae bacterium]|nr:ChbG/HpnK family deacetylase [Saprospiraceae bacterium]